MSYPRARQRSRFSAAAKHWLQLALALCVAAASPCALAERADKDKPVNIESESVDLDDGKREGNFLGNVQLTQGTLLIKADKIVIKQDKNGFQYGIAYGKPASFRQKREGVDEYIEGFGERIEYDSKADAVQFFKNAHIKRGGDDVKGDYISYNAVTEFFQVVGGPKDRVKVVIQPPPKPGDAPDKSASESGTPLKPTDTLRSEKP
jgi:lipopolysaccharide export system protein LptA